MVIASTAVNCGPYKAGTESVTPPLVAETVGRPIKGVTRVNKETPIEQTGWKLVLDLGVHLEYNETNVVATSPWVDDYAVGGNEPEAVQNLLLSLVDFRESLERRNEKAQLSDELRDTLEKLRLLLVNEKRA